MTGISFPTPKKAIKKLNQFQKWSRRPENNHKVNAALFGTMLLWASYRYITCQRGWFGNRVRLLNVAVRPLYLCLFTTLGFGLNLVPQVKKLPANIGVLSTAMLFVAIRKTLCLIKPQYLRKWQMAVNPSALTVSLGAILTYNIVCFKWPYKEIEKSK